MPGFPSALARSDAVQGRTRLGNRPALLVTHSLISMGPAPPFNLYILCLLPRKVHGPQFETKWEAEGVQSGPS